MNLPKKLKDELEKSHRVLAEQLRIRAIDKLETHPDFFRYCRLGLGSTVYLEGKEVLSALCGKWLPYYYCLLENFRSARMATFCLMAHERFREAGYQRLFLHSGGKALEFTDIEEVRFLNKLKNNWMNFAAEHCDFRKLDSKDFQGSNYYGTREFLDLATMYGNWQDAADIVSHFSQWHDYYLQQKARPRINTEFGAKPINYWGAYKHWFRARQNDKQRTEHLKQAKEYFYQWFANTMLERNLNFPYDFPWEVLLYNMMRIDLGDIDDRVIDFVRYLKPLLKFNAEIYEKAEALGVEYEPPELLTPAEVEALKADAERYREDNMPRIREELKRLRDESPHKEKDYCGLDVVVGVLADYDPEEYEDISQQDLLEADPKSILKAINQLLAENNLSPHVEPQDIESEFETISGTALEDLTHYITNELKTPETYRHFLNLELDQYILPIPFENVITGAKKKGLSFDSILSSYSLQEELVRLGKAKELDMELLASDQDAFEARAPELNWEQQLIVTLWRLCMISIEKKAAIWLAG